MKEVYEGIVSFLKNYQERTHVKEYVLGISGGKDSTVVAKLLVDSIGKEINNPYETNLNNPFQGEFQTYEFNKELVLYGIDHVKSHFNPDYKVRLIETCCDICAGHDLGIPYNYSIKTCKKNFDSVCK